MSDMSSIENDQKRDLQTDKKFAGIQIQDFNSDTISRMSRVQKYVLKVAIQVPNSSPQLYEINQNKSLKDNVKDFCERWKMPNPELYALQFPDSSLYITEENRSEVKDGALLKLATSPNKLAENLFHRLSQVGTSDNKLSAMKELSHCSIDPTFSDAFIKYGGLKLVIEAVEKITTKPENLAYALSSFLELMDHGIVNWDEVLTTTFIKAVTKCVNEPNNVDSTVLQRALGITECAVVNSQMFFSQIVESINVGNLLSHLQRSNADIQLNTIALLNGLILKTPTKKNKVVGRRKISDTLMQKQFRTVILNNVIRASKLIGPEMAHQLYVLQVLILNMLEERMMQKLDPLSQIDMENLFEIRNIAFETSIQPQGSKRAHGHAAFNSLDFKKLGFTNINNPVLDFDQAPPGVLSLDLMTYFANHHQNIFIKLVLENSSRDDKHECPFGKSSIEVTKKLCEILKIGEQPTELGQDYYPMFFTNNHAFEEFFSICIQLFHKTWKEMSAIKDDFDKVMSVFHDQVNMALLDKSSSFDSFKHKLTSLPYSAILTKREQERADKEQFVAQAKPIVELQGKVQPEILELIKQQRLNYMKSGTAFIKISSKRRDKSRWYCRLSPNHKVFLYGDIDEDGNAENESLADHLAVSSIKELVVGKHCPHIKHARAHKSTADLAFSIFFDPDESLNFIAPNKQAWCMWTDGIQALLGKKMSSSKAKSDLDSLLSLEMKLRLLELENIPIPDQPPKLPDLPKNYDFVL